MSILRSFFSRDLIPLKIASILFLVAIVLGHLTLPLSGILVLGAILSVTMNFTYPVAALAKQEARNMELLIAGVLIGLSLLSLWFSPWLLVLAIAGHGCWDLMKLLRRAGVGFEDWYCLGCAAADLSWAAVLALVLLQMA